MFELNIDFEEIENRFANLVFEAAGTIVGLAGDFFRAAEEAIDELNTAVA